MVRVYIAVAKVTRSAVSVRVSVRACVVAAVLVYIAVAKVTRCAVRAHPKTGIMVIHACCHRLKTRGDSIGVRRDVVLARLAKTSQRASYDVVIARLVVRDVRDVSVRVSVVMTVTRSAKCVRDRPRARGVRARVGQMNVFVRVLARAQVNLKTVACWAVEGAGCRGGRQAKKGTEDNQKGRAVAPLFGGRLTYCITASRSSVRRFFASPVSAA